MSTAEEAILKDLKELAAGNTYDIIMDFFLYTLTYSEIRLNLHDELMKKMFYTIHLLKDAQELTE